MSTDFGVKYETARDRLLRLVLDLQWHNRQELEAAAGNRYAARVLELKRLGYVVEDRESATGHGKDYRLTSRTPGAPQEKKVKVFLSEEDAELLLAGQVTGEAEAAVEDALGSFRANKHKL